MTLMRAWCPSSFPWKRESRLTMTKQPAVYILASKRNGTLYVGVTSNLQNVRGNTRMI